MKRQHSISSSNSSDWKYDTRTKQKKRAKRIVQQKQQCQQQEEQLGDDGIIRNGTNEPSFSYSSSSSFSASRQPHTEIMVSSTSNSSSTTTTTINTTSGSICKDTTTITTAFSAGTTPSQYPTATAQETSTRSRYRNLSKLYTCRDTYVCATRDTCIPCSYKIGTFDVALDTEFTQAVPNIRPEMCKRMQQNSTLTLNDYESGYGYSQEGMKILTVGDGDFSFSLALARIMMCRRKSTKNACRVEPKSRRQEDDETCRLLEIETCLVATSYEAFETLHRVYPDIQKTLDELERLNVLVCFNVDATDLLGTLPISVQNRVASFHRVIWNFPCTAIANGQDGQNQQMQDNQMLVRKFVNQCRNFLHPVQGEIHFMHKTKPPYDQWKLEEIAVQDLDQDDKNNVMQQDEANKGPCSCRIVYKGRVVFDRCLLLPYITRKALDKKSFPCHDACLFVFGWGCLPTSMGKSITTLVVESILTNLLCLPQFHFI